VLNYPKFGESEQQRLERLAIEEKEMLARLEFVPLNEQQTQKIEKAEKEEAKNEERWKELSMDRRNPN